MAFIYKITNIITKDFYIGKTQQNIEKRFRKHVYNSKNQKTHLCRAILKYGKNNFIIEVVEKVDYQMLDEREKYHIEKTNPSYNMTKGGEGGDTSKSPNYINAMKIYHSNKDKKSYATYGMLGKSHSQSSKKEIGMKNSYPVVCDGIQYPSIGEAQKANPGISIRKRLASKKYPTYYRLREPRKCPKRTVTYLHP